MTEWLTPLRKKKKKVYYISIELRANFGTSSEYFQLHAPAFICVATKVDMNNVFGHKKPDVLSLE